MNRMIGGLAVVLFLTLLPARIGCQEPARNADALSKGWELYGAAKYQEAYDAARAALKVGIDQPSALELAGRSAMAMGRPSFAGSTLTKLVKQRGSLYDYGLLLAALEMAGNLEQIEHVIKEAGSAKEPTIPELYSLAWQQPDAGERSRLLKRITDDFPNCPSSIFAEIIYWDSQPKTPFRSPAAPVSAEGTDLKLKTLWDYEWVPSKTGDGEELWLLFDTACRTTVISKDTARRLELPLVQASYPYPGAYPDEAAPLYTVIDHLDFGSYRVSNIPAIVVEDESRLLTFRDGRVVLKGIFGMDLLRGLKIRFDRQKNQLRLFPPKAPLSLLLDGDESGWHSYPAFSVHDQLLIQSAAGKNMNVMALLATGTGDVLVTRIGLQDSGLEPSSRKIINLTPTALFTGRDRNHDQSIGWLQETQPMVGQVRTIPDFSEIGFGSTLFRAKNLRCFPLELGGQVPIGVVIGKSVTDFYAIAWDLSDKKIYIKQVLFK